MFVIVTIRYSDTLFLTVDYKVLKLIAKFRIITRLLKQYHDQIDRACYFLVLDVFTNENSF